MAADLDLDYMREFKHSPNENYHNGSTVFQSPLSIRLGFIRKVYGILSVQLAFTTFFGGFFMYNERACKFVQSSPNLLYLGCISSIALIIALHFKRRESPTNFYLLGAFTFVESYTIGTVVTFYETQAVLQAFTLTLVTVISLTIYTFQSKRDFSAWGAGLFAVLWILIISGFMQIFIQSEIVDTALAAVGAIVFALFIVFDTHMLIHKLSPEEYILASISLYLDIINLFLEILKIVGKKE